MAQAAPDQIRVFDPAAVRAHRARAARRGGDHDFLRREVAERFAERLADITREFPRAVEIAPADSALAEALTGFPRLGTLLAVQAEADSLPLAEEKADAVFSLLDLHWVNDLPGALVQIRRALKPDGLFLAALFGGDTLAELRAALMDAELETEGGASPRVAPRVTLQDAGALLQRAGFALPVVDFDTITVTYADAFALMRDLRGMGETNAVIERRKTFTRRETLLRAAALYQERHGMEDGRIPATFQVVWLHGWAPHHSQQQPMRPGTAQHRLADALDTRERSAGDKARPK
jgi:SAM-dependent methyltransferase